MMNTNDARAYLLKCFLIDATLFLQPFTPHVHLCPPVELRRLIMHYDINIVVTLLIRDEQDVLTFVSNFHSVLPCKHAREFSSVDPM